MNGISLIFSSGGKDKPPVANAGRDVVVQPNEEVLLNGIESWDDRKITDYKWSLISGHESVRIEVLYWILVYELICYDVVHVLLMLSGNYVSDYDVKIN